MITSSITDLNIKTNNLLSGFSFCESTTLSRLFSSYCMNVYSSSLWRYSNLRNIEERFCISWRKAIRKLFYFIFIYFFFYKFYSEICTKVLTTINHIAFGVCKNHS